ncbi:Pescadillo N-terminus-domain-containing protein [Cladochytrium replicatum]|nr:Pescadillo N-terminus-domain-containing protein [Cladochytrium replicatum]
MVKIKKKGESGAVTNYITRAQAIKKLQVSLAQFRRLCILKGVYPREPNNKKKVGKGSTAPRTYYYRKDILFLLHEPLLAKLREQRVHERKISKAISKEEWTTAKSLQVNRPGYKLDHIIKERYPSFVEALRDMDDALCMIFLFATLPVDHKNVPRGALDKSRRLAAEFQRYVVHTRCLRKTFLSIKGIYYQVVIHGQEINWMVPYQFAQDLPVDVDFRVMGTFLELYQTLAEFVLYKLYTDENLVYPPTMDMQKDAGAEGLNCFILETKDAKGLDSLQISAGAGSSQGKSQGKVLKDRLRTVQQVISKIKEKDEDDSEMAVDEPADGTADSAGFEDAMEDDEDDIQDDETVAAEGEENGEEDMNADALAAPAVSRKINDVTTFDQLVASHESVNQLRNLFSKSYFWLSREVPRQSLEFVIRSLGGTCGWDATSGTGSPLRENDPRITYHIIDRPPTTAFDAPEQKKKKDQLRYDSREYIQPQWVYDCINAGRLLSTKAYKEGAVLPPHLSPFVKGEEGDYVPEEAYKLLARQEDDLAEELGEEEEKEAEGMTEATAERDDNEDEEESHDAEIAAEASGVSFSEYSKQNPGKADDKRQPKDKKKSAEDEKRELAVIMMSKKNRKLYNAILRKQKGKEEETEKLKQRKEALKNEKKVVPKESKQGEVSKPLKAPKATKSTGAKVAAKQKEMKANKEKRAKRSK